MLSWEPELLLLILDSASVNLAKSTYFETVYSSEEWGNNTSSDDKNIAEWTHEEALECHIHSTKT